MTKDQIQANKPDGATHYELDGNQVYYYKLHGNKFFIMSKKGWMQKPMEWIKDAEPL